MMKGSEKFPDGWATRQGGNIPLAMAEFLVRCPYDKSHHALNHRYGSHLRKCRDMYVRQKACLNDFPMEVNCRYNINHVVYAPEIVLHEHQCPDNVQDDIAHVELTGLRVRIYRILENADRNQVQGTVMNKENEERVTLIAAKVTRYQLDKSELGGGDPVKLKEIMDLLKEGLPCKTNPVVVHWADPRLKKDSEDPYRVRSSNPPRIMHRRNVLKLRQKMLDAIKEEEDDDEEDWGAKPGSGRKGFDWMEHQFKMKGPLRVYPPGLSRAERRQFEIENTERLKYEEGIFFEDD